MKIPMDVRKKVPIVLDNNNEAKTNNKEELDKLIKDFKDIINDNDGVYMIKSKEGRLDCCQALKKAEIDIVLLAHYQQPIGPQVLSEYTVINSYPSLLPKYGGKSEMQVHEAVLQNNEKETGVTLYFAKDVFDQSHIIWQTHVPVYTEDCAKDVLERVCAVEKTQLVSILKAFSEGKIDIPD